LRNTSRLLLGYYRKLVLESADENVYLREKERDTRLKKKLFSKLDYLEKSCTAREGLPSSEECGLIDGQARQDAHQPGEAAQG
jgi:hypothetical protein